MPDDSDTINKAGPTEVQEPAQLPPDTPTAADAVEKTAPPTHVVPPY